jgi:hypothetical protein
VWCVCGVCGRLSLVRLLDLTTFATLRGRSAVPNGINQRTMSGHWNKHDEEEDEVETEEDDNAYKVRFSLGGRDRSPLPSSFALTPPRSFPPPPVPLGRRPAKTASFSSSMPAPRCLRRTGRGRCTL